MSACAIDSALETARDPARIADWKQQTKLRSVDRLMEAECQPLEGAVDGARGHEEGELNPFHLLNHAGRKDGIGTNESVLIGTSNARVEETDHDDCFLIMVV